MDTKIFIHMKLRFNRSSKGTSRQTCCSPMAHRQGLQSVMYAGRLGKPKGTSIGGLTEAGFLAVLDSDGGEAVSVLREN